MPDEIRKAKTAFAKKKMKPKPVAFRRRFTNTTQPKVNPADPETIPKFIDPLPIPPVAKPAFHDSYYEIEMKEARHQFHSYFPFTTVWGYEGMVPGPTFDVSKDQVIRVKWINNLPYKHFLPVDYTLHGAIDSPEVRTVVHLHGANVDWESDGHPDAWFTRDFARTGATFKRMVYEYTNHQQGTTLWYHDHAIGITRLNVYAGLAGFYLIRDSLERRLKLPRGDYEIPLMLQDKSFNEDGSLFYPDQPPFPVSVKPSVVPGFFGNTIVVNGKVWPHLRVEPRKYRFRIVNASNRRGYTLSLSNQEVFTQIGTDGGLMASPVQLTSIRLEPAERADLIIDFSKMQGQTITLQNDDPNPHLSVVMQFRVDLPLQGEDRTEIPALLYPAMELHEHMAHTVRDLTLSATTDDFGRPMLLLGERMWHDPATEKPAYDSVEIWNLINLTGGPHPIHVHLVQFRILERRPFNIERYRKKGIIEYTGPAQPPRDYERGWKDTVRAEAGMVTKIIMHFKEHTGNYVWHCHFLEHEDHDMMRPLRVIADTHPVQDKHATHT